MDAAPTDAGPKRLGVLSSGLLRSARIRRILALLGWRVVYAPLSPRLDAVAGWGEKPTMAPARRLAARRGLPLLTLEDGFLRSAGLGVAGDPPLSLVVDAAGAYFNAASRSELERLLLDASWESAALRARARAAIATLRREKLSKYNHAPPLAPGVLPERYALVLDQTLGDAAIGGAGATAATFEAMARAATAEAEAEGLPVIIKTHPDVVAGARRGCLAADAAAAGARIFAEDANPWDVLAGAVRVYTVSSLMGYEALLAGKPVSAFGWPFYAGWSLTDDRAPAPPGLRRRARSLEALAAAAHLLYPVYYDPATDALADFETVAARLAASRPR